MRTITFLLPACPYDRIIGGYKIVYEYATRIAKGNSYRVKIVYSHFFNPRVKERIPFTLLLRIMRLNSIKKYQNWFELDNVEEKIIPKIKNFFLPNSDIYVCTSIETALLLAECKKINKSKVLYLIQDFEAWGENSEDDVYKSYKLPFLKIAISNYLLEKVKSVDENVRLIPNAFDFTQFYLDNDIETRSPYEIVMLNHIDKRKRIDDSLKALKIVKEKYPDLHVNMFGFPEKPKDLPEWFSYYQMPEKKLHNQLYNKSAIFIASSDQEGFSLPPAEAMCCGCAVCCTDIGGFAMYAINEITALISPVYKYEIMAQNIIRLISNNELRIKIAKEGNKYIQQFTWDKAVGKFLGYVNEYEK